MIRLVILSAVLFAFWLLLSGNYQTWLVVSGAVATVAVVAFADAKRIIDPEGFPMEKLRGAIRYWPWLLWQIVLSGINVTRIVLNPRLPISPRIVAVDGQQRSAAALVTYANSITLTPGTLSVEVSEQRRRIWVHALTRENAAGFADDEMNARVRDMDDAAEGEGDAARGGEAR